MRKFWRIGLILVIGLAACGDKKAEQAKALQQEMQDMLAKAASSKMFTYGDVAVTPDGDAFAVTVDKVAVTLPEVSPIDLGKIGFKPLCASWHYPRSTGRLEVPPAQG